MQTRTIGSLSVSVIGLGTNNFGGRLDAAQTDAVVGAALDAGITLFDTADIYGGSRSEEFLGKALGSHRQEVVVATKFGVPLGEGRPGGAGAAYVRTAAEASLRRLGTDCIDLYQLHFPDSATPLDETLAALNELVDQGKVREIGCSNFSAEQLDQAARAIPDGGTGFASVQNQFSLLHREVEKEVLPACARLGMAFIPYFPLANGLLTGKYAGGQPPPPGTRLASLSDERFQDLMTEETVRALAALTALAEQAGHSLVELAVAWLLTRPQVASVIAGATRPEQVAQNAAGGGWRVPPDVLAAIDDIVPVPA